LTAKNFTCGRALCILALGALCSSTLPAADVIIINGDAAGVGLNDPTVVAPVGGNPGTTLGEQRMNVLLRAAEIWADNLVSDVPIRIRATSENLLPCDSSAVLASAGAAEAFRDFPGAPLAGTWYHAALANAIRGTDNNPALHDVTTRYNLNVDDLPGCLGGFGWYYGFDHNEGNQVDLLATMLHEYGHGLGFANFVNEAVGTLLSGFPDVYSTFTRDLETMEDWNSMTNAERIASAINDPDVVWTGPNATAAALALMDPLSVVEVTAPVAIVGEYEAQIAAFGPSPPLPAGVSGSVILAEDGVAPAVNDGCEPFANGGAVSGNIALVERGNCNFTVKVANAQAVGAIAVLVANNAATGLPPMGGSDPTITIPSYGITMALGDAMRTQMPAPGVSAVLGYSATEQAGMNAGFLRVNAPNPLQPGSSISHWTPAATPSLLMEPAITAELTDDVDLTLDQYLDIGWTLNTAIFADGFESGDTTLWAP
jgi:hypothetical protein